MADAQTGFESIVQGLIAPEDSNTRRRPFYQAYPLARVAADDMLTYEQEAVTALGYDPTFEEVVESLFGERGLDIDVNVFLREVNQSAQEFGVEGEGVVTALGICIKNRLGKIRHDELEGSHG
ncbi:MAG TPA: hypothetical protein VLF88_02865 [Candidatus Babeliales bacterium]|nr:hypothetical protein [Candidatus Babeliales bacterium]